MSDDNGAYVRRVYRVPAYFGTRVIARGKDGTVVGFDDQYLLVRLDSAPDDEPGLWHPTWEMEYLGR